MTAHTTSNAGQERRNALRKNTEATYCRLTVKYSQIPVSKPAIDPVGRRPRPSIWGGVIGN